MSILELEVGGPKSVYQSFPRGYPLKTGSPCRVMWSWSLVNVAMAPALQNMETENRAWAKRGNTYTSLADCGSMAWGK